MSCKARIYMRERTCDSIKNCPGFIHVVIDLCLVDGGEVITMGPQCKIYPYIIKFTVCLFSIDENVPEKRAAAIPLPGGRYCKFAQNSTACVHLC